MRTLAIIVILLSLCRCAAAQTWRAIGDESFTSITGVDDGSLLLLREPGDVLRSTDAGLTWHEVYHGLRPLAFVAETPRHECVAMGYGMLLLSRDSGMSWVSVDSDDNPSAFQRVMKQLPPGDPKHVDISGATLLLDDSSNILFSRDGGASWRRVLRHNSNNPGGLFYIALVDSVCYAVGEPGLMYVSDSRFEHWRELHVAPFGPDTTRTNTTLAFATAAVGAVTIDNHIYCTDDSGTTWRASPFHDTSTVRTFLWTSDTSALIGTLSGNIFSTNDRANTWSAEFVLDSIVQQKGAGTAPLQSDTTHARPIVQIGWRDKPEGEMFVLTDTSLTIKNPQLNEIYPIALPLAPQEHASRICFPNKYNVFLLARDSITIDDTLRDTSRVYRSLDGGGTWVQVGRGIAGATTMAFANVRRGCVGGATVNIRITNDTGSTWSRGFMSTHNQLRDMAFINDTSGYCVGDSGAVLMTMQGGRNWWLTSPVPQFMHPGNYTSVAFGGDKTVYVIGQAGCFQQTIPKPRQNFRMSRRQTLPKILSVTANPNPVRGEVHILISAPASARLAAIPFVRISDLSGRTIIDNITCTPVSNDQWQATANCATLSTGAYVILATAGDYSGKCNLVVEN